MPFISHGSSLLKANVLIKQITVMARNWEEKNPTPPHTESQLIKVPEVLTHDFRFQSLKNEYGF